MLGSSYSWDALPSLLGHNATWHIFCGKPLYYIFDNPYGHCMATAWPWPEVLDAPAAAHDYITFQPVPQGASTRQTDRDSISYWLLDQPVCTTALIHPTWPVPSAWEAEIHEHSAHHTFTSYSIDYYYALADDLAIDNPGRNFALTRSNEMLDHIFHDPSSPIAFEQMFRDAAGHMSLGPGRYLQHNALRAAMGEATGIDVTTPGVDPEVKAYLDSVIALYPPHPLSTEANPCADDGDGDRVCDFEDNCLDVPNPVQTDSDQDGYGNFCDSDFTNNGLVSTPDFLQLVLHYGSFVGQPSYDERIDADVDGKIGVPEFLALIFAFGGPPGPSGLECAGSTACQP